MDKPMKRLHDEHRDIATMVELLRKVADSVGASPKGEVIRALDDAYTFLNHKLIPHLLAKELLLYPVVADFLGAPESTETMARDNLEIVLLAGKLEILRRDLALHTHFENLDRDLRMVLYGLYTLVRTHLANEDQVLLGVLDARLTPDEATELMDKIEKHLAESKVPAAL